MSVPPRLSHVIPVTSLTEPLPIDTLFDPARPLEVEIGCGKGRFLTARAAQNPDVQYLGIERMLSRVTRLDKKATRLKLDNLRILRLEAFCYRLLPAASPPHTYCLRVFPRPWPKRHHHNRRLFSPLFIDALWTCLEIGGTVQIATDHLDYFSTIRARLTADSRFCEILRDGARPAWWTEFEYIFVTKVCRSVSVRFNRSRAQNGRCRHSQSHRRWNPMKRILECWKIGVVGVVACALTADAADDVLALQFQRLAARRFVFSQHIPLAELAPAETVDFTSIHPAFLVSSNDTPVCDTAFVPTRSRGRLERAARLPAPCVHLRRGGQPVRDLRCCDRRTHGTRQGASTEVAIDLARHGLRDRIKLLPAPAKPVCSCVSGGRDAKSARSALLQNSRPVRLSSGATFRTQHRALHRKGWRDRLPRPYR